ncbi:MAG: Trk family potassium uptake protein [Chloroflexi bacterium]|nr:Trk family potassium uptake protein [Chloroflexota bacterium]
MPRLPIPRLPRTPLTAGRQLPRRSVRVPLGVTRPPRRALNAGLVFAGGFAALIAIGTVLLMLPISQVDGRWTPLRDAAFIAVSAACVTGLVVVDTGTHWSFFGQVVMAGLVQIGGFGFMILSTFLLRLAGRRTSLRERLLLQESIGGSDVGSALTLAQRVLLFTVVVEGAGAVMLTLAFLERQPLSTAIWWGIFHSITAFNNAGFDLTGGYQSMVPFADAPMVLLPLSVLVILGSLSYGVVEDVVRRRSFARLTLDSKLVLVVSAGLLVGGTGLLLFTERANGDTFAPMPFWMQVLNAFFHSTVTRSAGFNSVDLAAVTDGGLLVLIGLMLIGGAAGSTAGGIKVQTLGILLSATASAIRGLPDVVAFERRVPIPDVLRAIAVTVLAFALVFVATFLLGLTSTQPFLRELFEVVSAFATAGMSIGLTGESSPAGRLILMAMMFVGRLGPLTLALALAAREHGSPLRWPAAAVRIG